MNDKNEVSKNNGAKNNKKQNVKIDKKELEQLQRDKNIQLLELGGRDAKVLIANTIESKELLSKFIRVDAISKKSRELVGNKLSIAKFTELNTKFTEINKLIDEVIDFGTTENLFFDPQAQKFSTMKPKLVQLIADGKDKTAISKELNVNVKKVESWIKLLDSENKSLEKPSVTTTTKAAPKIAKVETKNSEAAEKVS
jgi:hypothetical protein